VWEAQVSQSGKVTHHHAGLPGMPSAQGKGEAEPTGGTEGECRGAVVIKGQGRATLPSVEYLQHCPTFLWHLVLTRACHRTFSCRVHIHSAPNGSFLRHTQELNLRALCKIRDTDLRAALTRLTSLTSLHLDEVACLVEDTLREVGGPHCSCSRKSYPVSQAVHGTIPHGAQPTP
jgi:hypothetical protein